LNEDLHIVLDTMTAHVEPIHLNYLCRFQLCDPNDEMVLETALNAAVDALVTFNKKILLTPLTIFSGISDTG